MPRADGRVLPSLALVVALLGSATAGAHEGEEGGLPDLPGWRVGAGVALALVDGRDPWPVARRNGVLLTGETARDRRGELSLEHASLGADLRVNRWWGASLDIGAHDRDSPHVETARLEADWTLGDQQLTLRAGRQSVPMGNSVDAAGHFDRFAQAPLAKLAVLNEDWIDDGLSLRWRRPELERGLQGVEVGLWRARAFPGGAHAPVAPSLRATAGWDHWTGQVFAAWLRPEGRGAAALGNGPVGHTHGVPDCQRSVLRVVCFEGRSQILGGSLSTDSDDGRWSATAAGLWRRERGQLYTQTGSADYRGDTLGAWADLAWQWRPDWTLAGRVERLQPRHTLSGPGASRVAAAAGLTGAEPIHRLALSLGYRGLAPFSLWLETGAEQARGGDREPYVALRLLWQAPRWLERTFE